MTPGSTSSPSPCIGWRRTRGRSAAISTPSASASCTRDLLLAGHAAEARTVLDDVDLAPPTGDEIHYAHLVLAAVHAACGDSAWSWLIATSGRSGAQSFAAPLVGAAADARGDLPSADAAWRESAGPSLAGLIRNAVSDVAARPRDDRAALPRLLGSWGGTVVAVGEGQPRTALAVADGLLARGDSAGARLLLRAGSMVAVDRAPLDARLRELRPTRQPLEIAGLVLLALVATAVLVAGVALQLGPVGVWAFIAGSAWLRYNRLPGMTRSESHLWREMRGWRLDPETGKAVQGSPHAVLYTVVGIVGFIAGVVLTIGVGGHIAEALAGGAGIVWMGTTNGVVLQILGTAAVAAGSVLAVRALVRGIDRTRAARRLESQLAASAHEGTACRCWSEGWLRGRLAESYARHHLETASVTVELPGSEIRSCPATGVLWLTGDLAVDGRALALRGRVPETSTPDATSSAGFCL